MKKLTPLLLAFLLTTNLKAYNFWAPTNEGVMLSYTVSSSSEPYTAKVVYGNYESDVEIIIPSIVTHNEIEYTVTSIDDYAFSGNLNLASITIPETVTNIGESAFRDCSGLTSITISESVTSIGPDAFFDTPWYNNNSDGVIYINKILYDFKGEMPANTEIEVLEGTLSINGYAFAGQSGLASITIPESVLHIGERAFRACSGLTSITIESVTSIGDFAFNSCSGLTSITISESVTSIGYGAFYDCSELTSITIPESVTHIGERAFWGCSGLTTITIPESIKSIGEGTFYGCTGLTAITIPKSVTSIGNHSFFGCSGLTSLSIPESVTSIGVGAFQSCSGLISIALPKTVTSLGDGAFSGCYALTSISIPESVSSIGDEAFAYCSGLKSMSISAITPPNIEAQTFQYVSREIPVTVPANSIDDYATNLYWGEFINMHAGDNPTSTKDNALKSYKIFNNNNQISIINPELLSVTVYDVNGRIINNNYSTLASPNIKIDLPKGIFIVLIGNESVKVVL